MAPLPAARITARTGTFEHCGCDLAGPYEILIGNRRVEKRWIVLYTCLNTRAIYLDCVPDCTTDALIQTTFNCNARRGPIHHMYCDCGTNLVGANNELQKSINDIVDENLRDKCLERKIEWHFNCPTMPWAGKVHGKS